METEGSLPHSQASATVLGYYLVKISPRLSCAETVKSISEFHKIS